MSDHDPLFDRLAALPRPEVAPDAARRQGARLRRVFVTHAALSPGLSRALRIYLRYLEPVGLAGATAAYLVWAFNAAAALYR